MVTAATPIKSAAKGISADAKPSEPVATASFEDAFDAELRDEFGDLGPAAGGGRASGNDRSGGRGARRRN